MSAISPRGGKADRALGLALWAKGLRYRRKNRMIGNPDLVFPSARVAVFVDGDFWHGRGLDDRIARGDFKTNADYWIPKLRRNAERDIAVTRVLTERGWHVIRVWESAVKTDVCSIANQVEEVVRARKGN